MFIQAIIYLFLLDSEHIKYLKEKYPRQSKRVKWQEDEHVCTFSYWLKEGMKQDIHTPLEI